MQDSKDLQSKSESVSNANNKTTQNKAITLEDNRPSSILQKKANNTGLPDNLKSGIENLSGHSMDDVKVHYNSDKPAQLNAHAYAQGSQIHIASGQEKHLPHEAWHVVQQKQGRVKPTMQMKGKVNVNDDAGLEKEADMMGSKALQMKSILKNINSRNKNTSKKTLQRKISVKVNKEDKYKGEFNNYLDALNKAVQKAYFFVIHYPDLKSYAQLDGHTEHWVEAWKNFSSGKEKGQGLIKAAFGYAVETLSTIIYLGNPGGGLTSELQGIRGGTRPDIILKDGDTDVGWLDITASESEGHVWKKAGWITKDINKGEVSYPSLDPQIIKDNVENGRQYDDQTDPSTILQRVNYFKYIQAVRRAHWKNIGEKYFGTPLNSSNKEHKKQYIRKRLASYLNLDYYDLPPQVLGSVLYAMGQGIKKHGYNVTGLSKAKGESILQEHDRELPGVENFSPQIEQNILSNASPQQIQELISKFSGKSGFNPSFEYDPFLIDNSTAITTKNSGEIIGIEKSYRSYLGKRIDLNYFELKSLISRMKASMRENALKGFGLKVQLDNGTIGYIRIDEMTASSLKRYFLQSIKSKELRKKKREDILWKKRQENIFSHTIENQSIPRSLSLTHSEDIITDDNDFLNTPLSFQVLGFAFQFEDGRQVVISSIEDFQQQSLEKTSHKQIE